MVIDDFFWNYLPFWVVSYATAIVAWSAVGRFVLEFFVPPNSSNYILRWFQLLTNWAIRLAAFITPAYVNPRFLPLCTAFWCFALRYVFFFILLANGMVPKAQGGM